MIIVFPNIVITCFIFIFLCSVFIVNCGKGAYRPSLWHVTYLKSKANFRISKIDTPEIRTDYENAIKSRNRFLQLIGVDIDLDSKKTKKEIKSLLIDIFVDIECKSFDKYGRVLCNVYKDNVDLGQTLIDENFACVYNLK